MRGKRFVNRNELIRETEVVMNTINRESSLIGMANLPSRWKEFILREGDYMDT